MGENKYPEELFSEEHVAWDAWIANGCDADVDEFRDAYVGQWSSVSEYVEEVYNDCYTVPEELQYYVDWDKMARDWQYGGDIWVHEESYNSVHIFRNI
jgi:antirestriction protein